MTRTQMTGIGLAGALLVAAAATQAQTRGGAPQPVADAVRAAWDGAKKNIRESAEFMPCGIENRSRSILSWRNRSQVVLSPPRGR